MTGGESLEAASAEERLARLVDRLLQSAESAASAGAWNRVADIATDILAATPGNARAAAMLERARVESALPEGQRAFVSLVFSDIVRATDLADATEPEVVRDLFDVYRHAAVETIEGLGGHVLQFYGDGVFASFGYPNVHEDDAKRAVLAGLGLVERMAAAAPELRDRYGIDAVIRVGVHTGTVVVSSLVPGPLDSLNIVGVAANTTARLQNEAEPGTVVISEATRQLVEGDFELVALGTRELKGIARPIEVFRVLRARHDDRLPPGRIQAGILIGRDEVRQRLRRTWDRVVGTDPEGSGAGGSMVVLRGPAGIGKSRVAADLSDHVQEQGGAVLQAGCSPYHANVALWPIGRMLEHRFGLYPGQPSEQRFSEVESRVEARGMDKARVLPLLAQLLGLDTDPSSARPALDPLALRAETLKVLAEWLARFARSTPSLLLVEDLHWADPTTVDLLGLLAGETPPGAMILVTTREPLTAAWAALAVDIELQPLDDDEAAALVAAMAVGHVLAAELRELIVRRGGGVPLFVQELARSALTGTPGETLPPRLQELLASRLRGSGIDLRVAQLAAAFGPVFDEGPLRELAGGPVIEALAQLQSAGIVEPLGDARRTGYRFRHVLLRDAAYETQVLDTRRATHRRIAQILGAGAGSPGDMAVVAQHHDLAGDAEQGVPAYIEAGQAAQAEASHTEARHLLDRALEMLASLPVGAERDLTELRARLLRSMSVSSLYGYGYADVLDDFQTADDICRRHPDRIEIMPAQVGIWSYMLTRGELDAAKVVLEPLARVVDSPSTTWFAPEIRSCMGFNAFYSGDLRLARQLLEEAWAGYLARTAEASISPFWPLPNDPVPVTAVALACVAGLQGADDGSLWEQRATSSAEQIGFPRGPFSAAFVNVYLAWIRLVTGDAAGTRSFGLRAMEIAAQHRFDYFTVVGRPYTLVADPAQPVDATVLEECETAMELVGHGAFRPAFLGIVARNYLLLGDFTRALERVEEALLRAHNSGELVHEPALLRLRARITSASAGRAHDAATDLLAAVETGTAQGSLVVALGAANDLARLPEDARPAQWRDVLQRTLDRVPPASGNREIADALAILGS